MAPKLIGLAGYARTGKDTVAAYLADRYGYERRAFADKLRELALELDFPFTYVGTDLDPSHIRTTWAQAVKEHGYEKAKERGGRDMLVALGAGCRKVLGPDVWLDALLPYGDSRVVDPLSTVWLRSAPTVVSDVRYLNEAERIVDLGGEVWYITRPGVEPANDEEQRSIEQLLVHGPWVRELQNWGTVEELHHEVDLALAREAPL